ncbi:MAG: polysaccharide deacetylase family protein [Acidobacteriota bacterium]
MTSEKPLSLPFETDLRSPGGRRRELARRLISWSALPLGTIVRVATREAAVALTFDDGPDPETTPRVLEVLERHGARGTFFVVGKRVRRHPEIVERTATAGHALANHSWDHPSFRRVSGPMRRAQIRWCADELGTRAIRLFRPPFGEQSLASRLDVLRSGHRVVCWDVVAEDWRDDPAERLVARVVRRMRRGSIVVFHDSLYVTDDERFRDRRPTLQALETLLQRFAGELRFVTVPELLALGRPVRGHHYHRLPLDFHRRLR